MDLPDLNVWFALLVPEHPFHPRARSYWEGTGAVGLVRVTALGLLRLLTNPKAMDGKPLELGEAWGIYRELRVSSSVPLWEEPDGLEEAFANLVARGFPPRLWTDAYLAAFAMAGGYRLVTFDRDFLSFSGLECLLLEA
ncbi:Ribonuclease VapC41 [Meiothermus luteus]|jgi:toxin-antitoxin system PIN domain toxin|uniref:Ribonuclease VapC n=1 Tax=Meiothermus luteus TaxID=2026184 RepID=A0A399EDI6_9DEIN|nr:TA system VapC family ribonuclease toxin [Meiothermus luteus]RIH81229.1 Ribonuclease VapC41 [Meiothermus luteus]